MRIVDPLILPISAQFSVTPATAALLTTAYALPYALAQPFLQALSLEQLRGEEGQLRAGRLVVMAADLQDALHVGTHHVPGPVQLVLEALQGLRVSGTRADQPHRDVLLALHVERLVRLLPSRRGDGPQQLVAADDEPLATR